MDVDHRAAGDSGQGTTIQDYQKYAETELTVANVICQHFLGRWSLFFRRIWDVEISMNGHTQRFLDSEDIIEWLVAKKS